MTSRRFFFIVALVALLAVGVAIGNGSRATPETVAVTAAGPDAATLASSNTVWFCPGPPTVLPKASGRITFSNIGDQPADVEVTDLADKGSPTHSHLSVSPNSLVSRPRTSLGAPGALTIETFGGRVLVEEGVTAPDAFETTPCATRTSPHWYFAAGSTPRGVQQWLVIANPYASDAKVDVTLRTSTGVRKPEALQGMDVSRRSRQVIAVHDVAVRQDRVAVEVDAQVGSVVAAQTSIYTFEAGTPGVAQTLGSPAPASDWTLTGGLARPDATTYLAIANVGGDSAQVDVQPAAERARITLAPAIVSVAQDAVVWVQLGRCAAGAKACVRIPDNTRYLLEVRSEQNISIVAQIFSRFDLGSRSTGTTTAMGAIVPSRSWAFGRTSVTGQQSTAISLFNPGADPTTVDMAILQGGRVVRPADLQHAVVAPGRQMTFFVPRTTGRHPGPDGALTITASQPIFAERTIVVDDEASTSSGVVAG